MHFAKKFRCRVTDVIPAAPGVLQIRFEPSRLIEFEPGQFLSMIIPPSTRNKRMVKRCYSFSCSLEEAMENGYEICVKLQPGGVGSFYVAYLRPGDFFDAFAPYGDFRYQIAAPGRTVCFICTSTGIAPFRAMVYSRTFLENPPKGALLLYGAHTEKELLYVGSFESVGVTTVHAVSNVSGEWSGFRGRVTDYLHHLPPDWNWHATDFYVCGNGGMVFEVASLLTDGYGVPPTAIHRECFSAAVERTPSEMLLSSTTAPALLNTQTDISVRNRLLRLPFAFRQSG